ncbi:MAG TPA: ROK family protein [Candidatus Limnocylindrales bacterium]|nr:ROK family protein [Candidatus Limnocylindrales bacterium]
MATRGMGIDIGGTGVKAALVDLETGELVSRKVRMATPKPATPEAVAQTVRTVIDQIGEDNELPPDLPFGIGLPGVVVEGTVMTAANIAKSWIGTNAEELLGGALGRKVHVLNDADAAAIAEARLGAGRGIAGTVLLLTIGTGIGSGLLVRGRLVPNTEFGHLEYRGREAETRLSGAARLRRGLRWRQWAEEFNGYLERLELYFCPDLIILGGGVSKELGRFGPMLKSRAPIVAAQFLNTSGIVGAAMYAAGRQESAAPLRLVAVEESDTSDNTVLRTTPA